MAQSLQRILYLEDDPSIAEIATLSLTEFASFTVHHCERGTEAIGVFETFQPDLLLFDVMLPGMDGIQTLDAIKQLPGGIQTPAIFMTAKAQTHEQKKYMENGAIGVIVKPFDAFTLGDQVRSVWEARRKMAHQVN